MITNLLPQLNVFDRQGGELSPAQCAPDKESNDHIFALAVALY
jgi:hypothetical protein